MLTLNSSEESTSECLNAILQFQFPQIFWLRDILVQFHGTSCSDKHSKLDSLLQETWVEAKDTFI